MLEMSSSICRSRIGNKYLLVLFTASIDEYGSMSGKILCHLVPEKEFILTSVLGKPLSDSDEIASLKAP